MHRYRVYGLALASEVALPELVAALDEERGSEREADVADPVFEAAVLDIMDRERERADGERETRRAELRTERRQRISESLATNLGLDEPQKARVGELISAHFDSMRALRSDDNPERPVTPREWREKAAELDRAVRAVAVPSVQLDPRPPREIFNPSHPDADERGVVLLPNVSIVEELVNLRNAQRSFEANLTAVSASREMAQRALRIGRNS